MPKKVAFVLLVGALVCVNCAPDLVPESLRHSKAVYDSMVEQSNQRASEPVQNEETRVDVVVVSVEAPAPDLAVADPPIGNAATQSATASISTTEQSPASGAQTVAPLDSPTEPLTATGHITDVVAVTVTHAPAVVRVVLVEEVDPSQAPTPAPPHVVVAAQSATTGPAANATPAAATEAATVEVEVTEDVTATTTTLASTTGISTTVANAATVPVGPPAGMVGVEDNIWITDLESTMANAFQLDGVEQLDVHVNGAEVAATAHVQIIPLLTDRVEARGHLAVVDESLVVLVDQVLLGGEDVTGAYGAILEQRLESALYRLLPERFVQGFAADDRALTVQSWMRRR